LAILSDRGPAFKNQEFNNWLDVNHIKHHYAFSYHPQGNAILETAHRGMNITMRIELEKNPNISILELSNIASFVHNAVPIRAIQISPINAMFGLESFSLAITS